MKKQGIKNIKLGIFVTAGLLFLILLLYMIGKNQNLWGAHFVLKAHFDNVQGLSSGNNVRYSGIQAGTVESVSILNDSTIEVKMRMKNSVKQHIRNNALVTIGTDGLVGNKIVNILPGNASAPPVSDGSVLRVQPTFDTDELLQRLARTTNDIGDIAAGLKQTVTRINNSSGLWTVLDDKELDQNLRLSLINVRQTTADAREMAATFNNITQKIANGEGSIGSLISDTTYASKLNESLAGIRQLERRAETLIIHLDSLVAGLQHSLDHDQGTMARLLKDSSWTRSINSSLQNIRQGTGTFTELMNAAKNSILFRGYFRKQERSKERAARTKITSK